MFAYQAAPVVVGRSREVPIDHGPGRKHGPPDPHHHHRPKPFDHLNSMIAETLLELADDLADPGEIEQVIAAHDTDALELFNQIVAEGVTDVRLVISEFVTREAEQAIERRREIVEKLKTSSAAVFLPLPPHIVDHIRGVIPAGLCFNTEDKEPAHLHGIHREQLTLNNLSDVSSRLRQVEGIVVDGQKANRLLIVRSSVAALLEILLDRGLKTIYFHRIPHIPKGQAFSTINLADREVRIATI